MRRNLLIALALVGCLSLGVGASTYKTFEVVTVADTAIGLTSTTYSPAGTPQMKTCILRVETADVRMRWDGTAPTASIGFLVPALDAITISSHEDISQLRMIRTAAVSASVTAVCWSD